MKVSGLKTQHNNPNHELKPELFKSEYGILTIIGLPHFCSSILQYVIHVMIKDATDNKT